MLYLSKIADIIADRVNDETLSSTGTNYDRTKAFINEFLFLDLIPRYPWSWSRKEGTITTANGTQRYSLPRWVRHPRYIHALIHPTSKKPLIQISEKEVAGYLTGTNDPTHYVLGPRVRSTYTTGTVSGSSGSKTLTGDSTSWTSSDLEQYDIIQVGSVAYTVDSVDSDTEITLLEDIITTISSSTSYTALIDRWKIDIYETPNAVLALELIAFGQHPEMQDDSDVPLFQDEFHYILVKGGVVLALRHNNEESARESAELESDIRKMIKTERADEDYQETFKIIRRYGGTSLRNA